MIKFRAWNKDTTFCKEHHMIEWNQIYSIEMAHGNIVKIKYWYNGSTWETNIFEIMQYIGKKDRNKKDIYKDDLFFDYNRIDILRITWNNEKALYEFLIWGKKKWSYKNIGVVPIFIIEAMEIIGNIHENRDLFK